jgi:hypothetical protein
LLRDDLLIFGDHPGQFMRLWYPVRGGGRLLGWNPLWYAGYPELQFYPPGFVMLGWLLDRLTLGLLSDFSLYQLLLFLACLLPGPAVYFLVSRATGDRTAGVIAGGLALVFAGLWGGATSLFVGLVAERLAFGLVPLAMLAGWRALHAERRQAAWLLSALLLAATALMHPFHAVAPVLFVGVVALRSSRRTRLLAELAGTCVLAVALIGFWLVPLLARSRYAAPMIRADLAQTLDWLFGRGMWPWLAAAGAGAVIVAFAGRRARPFALATAITGVAVVAIILLDHALLVGVLGFYALDPVRFGAEFYLSLVLLAGVGLGTLPGWLARSRLGLGGALLGGVVALLAVTWLARPFADLLRDQRDPAHFLAGAQARYGLSGVWDRLSMERGRVLFASHYLYLDHMPTALKAATPYFAGRPIVGGTFSHWSPVARALWVGEVDAELLPGQVELTDDVSLGGRAWGAWTGEAFFNLCHRLNATTVAATWGDARARTFLDGASQFEPYYSDDVFLLYRVLDPAPALVQADGAEVTLLRAEPEALDLDVAGASPGATLHIKITDYPLWRVEAGGEQLTHHADDLGLMTVPLPPGSYPVRLRYVPGVPERAGTVLSLLAVAAWSATLVMLWLRDLPRAAAHPRDGASA